MDQQPKGFLGVIPHPAACGNIVLTNTSPSRAYDTIWARARGEEGDEMKDPALPRTWSWELIWRRKDQRGGNTLQ